MKHGLELLKNMSILYAEDDVLVQKSTAKILTIFFAKVHLVNNGVDALKVYERVKPNVIMLDVEIPVVDGLEVARRIRENDLKTPIIIHTAHNDTQYLHRAIKLNLSDYLFKPFSFEQLRLSFLEMIEKMEQNGLIYAKIDTQIVYSFLKKVLFVNEEMVKLTKSEVTILEELLHKRGMLVDYTRLERALGLEYDLSKASIKNIVLRLRKKIGKERVVNVQDFGYLMP